MFAGTVYSNANRALDLYGDAVEVDYRGDEVTVENFIRLLTGVFLSRITDCVDANVQAEWTRIRRSTNDSIPTSDPTSSST